MYNNVKLNNRYFQELDKPYFKSQVVFFITKRHCYLLINYRE